MKYAHYNQETQEIEGFYDSEVHGKVVDPVYEDKLKKEAVKDEDGATVEPAVYEQVLVKEGYLDLSLIPKPNIEINDDTWEEALDKGFNSVDVEKKSLFYKDHSSDAEKKERCQSLLMTLCDNKQNDAQTLILGCKATPLQIERYKDKYARAKLGEWDEETNKSIIQNHELYLGRIRMLVDLIEYFRGYVDDVIERGDLTKANKLIEAGRAFDHQTSIDDIKELFKS